MSILTLSFLSLGLTALTGLLLFFGYTFRTRNHLMSMYPLVGVRLHIVSVLITAVLLTMAFWAKLSATSQPAERFSLFLFGSSYALFIVTLLLGLFFYFRFDFKRLRLRSHFLVLHWVLASLTFIFLLSSLAIYAGNVGSSATARPSRGPLAPPPVLHLHKEMRDLYLQAQNAQEASVTVKNQTR